MEEQAECPESEDRCQCTACRKSYLDGYWTGRQDGIWQEVEAKAEAKARPNRKSRKYWKRKARGWQKTWSEVIEQLEDVNEEYTELRMKQTMIRHICESWVHGTPQTITASKAMGDISRALGIVEK